MVFNKFCTKQYITYYQTVEDYLPNSIIHLQIRCLILGIKYSQRLRYLPDSSIHLFHSTVHG